ncbi:MAG: SulP family inorganic anion transporter [Longimicrobiales bacterium]
MSVTLSDPSHRFSLRDVLAGLSVALVAIPQGMAYAELAGLPGHHGLYAVSVPLVAAAFFASSPYLQTGPVATTALLTFGALVPLAAPGSPEFVAMAALLALVVGAVRVLVGSFRLGWVSYLMSLPVLEGFMAGAALLILASQLPGALGLAPAEQGSVLARAVTVLTDPGTWDLQALVLSAGTVGVIVGAQRVHPLVPGVMVAAAGGLVWSVASGYAGPVIGDVPEGLPHVSLAMPWRRLPDLFVPGLVIALVGFAEASSISRTFASEERDRWSPDREFVSQGAANLASGLVGGFPVGGSFARSSLNRMAGATSRWSGLVTGVAVLAFLPFAGFLGALPRAVLAGIVIAAVRKLLRPEKLLRLGRISWPQAAVGWTTLLLTLALAPRIEQAVLLGMVISGSVHLWRELAPDVAVWREGTTLHLAPSGVLWFASAPVLDDTIRAEVADAREIQKVVLHCQGLGRIDLTGALALSDMLDHLRDAGLEVDVEGVPDHAQRVLRGVGAHDETEDAGP